MKINQFKLNIDINIPVIGLGTSDPMQNYRKPKWLKNVKKGFLGKLLKKLYHIFVFTYQKRKNDKVIFKSILSAIHAGYRMIDTSAAYGNESIIGKAIRKSGIPRDQLFIVSRVNNDQQKSAKIRQALEGTLKELGMDYLDIYMFHWPIEGTFIKTWHEMEKLYEEGLTRSIGVANCHIHHLEKILTSSHTVPAVNQIEIHPLLTQKPLIEYCQKKNIQVEAYTPIARNDDRLKRSLLLRQLAKKYMKTIPQVILKWHIQNGIIPIPRSFNKNRQLENISIFDFKLTQEELKKIDSLNINSRLRYDPDNCDFTKP